MPSVKDMGYPAEAQAQQNTSMYVNNYRPPEVPGPGDTVLFYIDGDKSKTPQTAIVAAVYERLCDLTLIDARNNRLKFMPEVSFVDDPRLRENEDARHFGGWDFKSQKYDMDAFRARIEALEEKLAKKG